MKKYVLSFLLVALIASSLVALVIAGSLIPDPDKSDERVTVQIDAIVYENTQFGFSFVLPEGWKNYSILEEKWEGLSLEASMEGKVVETGCIIKIRHPLWTSENPKQDIPIMIFSAEQWDSLQKEEFSIGAAPVLPRELGRNSKYVFALPARYNYGFLPGYEEVEDILNKNPLKPIDI